MGALGDSGSCDPLIGTSVGRYVLLERIGAGGMGTVFLALDPELERNVALKLLPPAPRRSALRDRQLHEAKVMAMVAHPNVAAVYDLGAHDERIFIAMEFVDGWSLKRWLREPRPWREILDVFVQAARGLAAAHDRGLVHRDFKPGNVMVGRDGRARVVDFGLARRRQTPSAFPTLADEDADEDTRETAVGTPAYMAPEQRLGRETDARSDQFSFCLALWEGLYGERPFAAADLPALGDEPCPRFRPIPADSDVPAIVHEVLERGLAADPARRFASMRELIEALQRSAGDPPSSRRAARPLTLPARYRDLRPIRGLVRSLRAFDAETEQPVMVVLGERSDGELPALESLRHRFSLTHPQLAPVVDMGFDGEGLPFYTLAVAGEVGPLVDHLRAQSRGRRLQGLRSLLAGLAALHAEGVVHGALGARTAFAVDGRILVAPVVVVPAWSTLAPERLMGKPPSAAADLYAVGTLAFEIFAGSPAYAGDSWEEVTDAVLSRMPAYEAIGDRAVEGWIRGLLAERPERRIHSATEAMAQLSELSTVKTPAMRAATP